MCVADTFQGDCLRSMPTVRAKKLAVELTSNQCLQCDLMASNAKAMSCQLTELWEEAGGKNAKTRSFIENTASIPSGISSNIIFLGGWAIQNIMIWHKPPIDILMLVVLICASHCCQFSAPTKKHRSRYLVSKSNNQRMRYLRNQCLWHFFRYDDDDDDDDDYYYCYYYQILMAWWWRWRSWWSWIRL